MNTRVVDVADLVHRDDVGVREPGGRLRLAFDPVTECVVVSDAVHQLERDAPLQTGIERRVDRAEAAATDPIDDDEAADGDGWGFDAQQLLCHGGEDHAAIEARDLEPVGLAAEGRREG